MIKRQRDMPPIGIINIGGRDNLIGAMTFRKESCFYSMLSEKTQLICILKIRNFRNKFKNVLKEIWIKDADAYFQTGRRKQNENILYRVD